MHECVLGCAVIVFVKCTFGDTWNWDMKAWGAIKVTDISVLGVTHGLCALPRASLLLANLHLVTALSWPVDAFAMCCVWLVQVGCIPHICQFWYTTTICKPEKEHQKCVNLRQNTQNWPEWAKILCSPCKKVHRPEQSTPPPVLWCWLIWALVGWYGCSVHVLLQTSPKLFPPSYDLWTWNKTVGERSNKDE